MAQYDIIERLRANSGDGGSCQGCYSSTMDDAADEIERLRADILGWKLTALAMRDEALHWEQDGKPRCSEIECMYFDAAMGVGFVPPKPGQIGYVDQQTRIEK